MNILDINKDCVGCGACVDSCPADALKLEFNNDGFYEPVLDNDKCFDCSKCVKVCPVIEPVNDAITPQSYYGWINDYEIRKNSTSGGAFSAIADEVLKQGGVVFGAKYGDDFKYVEMASTEECTLDDLRVSKYCQTRSNGLYKKISRCLKDDKKVMLTGTPCQIAAARKMFGNNENLLLVDFICGGVSPETAYADYINWLEKKYKSEVVSVNMRDKFKGWNEPHVKVVFENGKQYIKPYQLDYYNHYFYTTFMKNEQCTHCSFTNHSSADITIADFWGYKQANIPCYKKGLSLICLYTDKAKKLLGDLNKSMTLFELEEKDVKYAFGEKNKSESTLKHRRYFLDLVREKGFIGAAKTDHFKGGTFGIYWRAILRRLKIK